MERSWVVRDPARVVRGPARVVRGPARVVRGPVRVVRGPNDDGLSTRCRTSKHSQNAPETRQNFKIFSGEDPRTPQLPNYEFPAFFLSVVQLGLSAVQHGLSAVQHGVSAVQGGLSAVQRGLSAVLEAWWTTLSTPSLRYCELNFVYFNASECLDHYTLSSYIFVP